jgi:hypothetical protein
VNTITDAVNRTTELDPFLQIAKWIAHSQNPFTNFYEVFHLGMKLEGEDSDDDEDIEEDADEDMP